MSTGLATAAPPSIHLGEESVPWVTLPNGTELKVLHVRLTEGLWVIRTRFPAGVRLQTHRHTGPVWAFTIAGAWRYLEYEDVNRAGSFLYEPANSVHTLAVLDDNAEPTDVWFHIVGANLNLGDEGEVESVSDAASTLDTYLTLCAEAGLGRPATLID